MRLAAVAMSLVLTGSMPAGTQFANPPTQLAWVGFYNYDLLGWLENENRLDDLCPPSMTPAEARRECRADALTPATFLVSVYAEPDTSAPSAGSLLLVAEPGQGLRFYYIGPDGGGGREFTPDLYLADWGYGPYYHQTILDQRGTWFLLPEDPFPAGTWFNAADLVDPPHVEHAGGIVTSPLGNLVILAIEPDAVRARPEQPADMWCEGGDPPSVYPFEEIRIPRADLYTPTGHLRIAPAYMKGC